jgi:hypothetical protein
MGNWKCNLDTSPDVNGQLQLEIIGDEGFNITGNSVGTVNPPSEPPNEFHFIIVEIEVDATSNNSQTCEMTNKFSHQLSNPNNFEIFLKVNGVLLKGGKPNGQISHPKK